MTTAKPNHKERKHSKFSASGASRWFACPGSVELSEGMPSKDTVWSLEGTKGHEVLEQTVKAALALNSLVPPKMSFQEKGVTSEMTACAKHAASHILGLYSPVRKRADLLIEERVSLDFVHPDAFGSLDYAIADHFGTLHILDYKYGKKLVSPIENLQFIFYALGVAHKFHYNFETVRMWTLQPRASGFDGSYSFWDCSIRKLLDYKKDFKNAVKRVLEKPDVFNAGEHCFFCPAQVKCPLKRKAKLEKAKFAFSNADE